MNIVLRKTGTFKTSEYEIETVSKRTGLHPKLVELLFSRGICTEEEIARFLHAEQSDLYDPMRMKNMDVVTDRIRSALEAGEKIVVFGDYDADGVCASAILSLYFASCGADVVVHIPSREKDGYGLNVSSLEEIIEEHCPDLILTCDCGISGIDEVAYCQDLGVDIIVTDHHEPGKVLPSCPVVNPKQEGDDYPDKYLCGAGVALKLVQALCGDDSYADFLDIAAVATIADLVPLLNENRLIVQLGLKKLSSGECNLGLKALLKRCGITGEVRSSDIGYKLAPRINAAGRMGDAFRAFEMLTTDDEKRIEEIVSEIEEANELRKTLCDRIYEEAEADLAFEDMTVNRAIILTNPSWSKGVTGIAAARFAGEYNRPTFILVDRSEDGIYKGTARGIKGINIYEALAYCADLLTEFGGHTGAAGFSIKEENIEAFKRRMNEYMQSQPEDYFLPNADYDLEIEAEECDTKLLAALSQMEPTGNSNAKPLFKITAEKVRVFPCKNPVHSSVQIGPLQTYAFNFVSRNQFLMGDAPKDIVLELTEGLTGGVSGYVKAVVPSSLFVNDKFARANYLAPLMWRENRRMPHYTEYTEEELPSLLPQSVYGTLVICADSVSYRKVSDMFGDRFAVRDYMYRSEKNNYSGIIVSPLYDDGFFVANFSKIVFADEVPTLQLVNRLNEMTNAEIYLPKQKSGRIFEGIDTSRETFGKYFAAIKSHKEAANDNLIVYFKRLSSLVEDLSAEQFVACLAVFTELGFFALENGKLTVNGDVQRPLAESKVYRTLANKQ